MSMNPIAAANAYRNQIKLQSDIADSPGQEDVEKPSFFNLVKEGIGSAVDTQYKTEAMKMDAVAGKVDLADLVTAISNAELSLNTVVAVRDKVIGAYQDIIRMPM